MKKIVIVMPKRAALPRLILALLLAGAGLSANADSDEGVAIKARIEAFRKWWSANADLGEGIAAYNAYKKGDYATALREWEPLPNRGMPLPSPIWA